MNIETNLAGTNRDSLTRYVVALIDRTIPDGKAEGYREFIDRNLDDALHRTMTCINRCRLWTPGTFNYLHSSQFCTFLYLLSNSIWRASVNEDVCTRLFLVNKALNGIDLFYKIDLPEPFFIGHSVGIVLAQAKYGRRLVLYQNSTVGKGGNHYPSIDDDVILYPNSAVIGRCHIGSGTVASQGVSIINRNTPGDCIAFNGRDGNLEFKKPSHKLIEAYFRSEDELENLLIGGGG